MFMFLSRHYSQLTKIEAKTIGYAPLETWKLGLILFCLDTASNRYSAMVIVCDDDFL